MQALYLEIKNLIISTLNLEELTQRILIQTPRSLATASVWTQSTPLSWGWR